MFAKRGVQKNVKKRVPIEDIVAEEKSDSSDEEGTSRLSAVLSGTEKKRRTAGKQPLVMTTGKEDTLISEYSSVQSVYESNYALSEDRDQRVAAVTEHDTAIDHDHRAILERNERIGKALLEGELKEGIYRGLGAHRPIVNRREGAISAGKHSGLYGPVRGNQHVRMTMRIDLNPEICKDYKETGYCGFGDTCIFLHDRSDYKPGWQLEKEWEAEQRKKQAKHTRRLRRAERSGSENPDSADAANSGSDGLSSDSDGSSDDEDASCPSACMLCGTAWNKASRPVVTQCTHYFCEKCALLHYAKSSKCAKCGEPTNGVFNTATALLNRLDRERGSSVGHVA